LFLGSHLVTVFILPLLFLFFYGHGLMQGEKTTAEKPVLACALQFERRHEATEA